MAEEIVTTQEEQDGQQARGLAAGSAAADPIPAPNDRPDGIDLLARLDDGLDPMTSPSVEQILSDPFSLESDNSRL